ncbi:gliding motility-associated ABC transporter substrate-binding protein GldG [Flavobacteriaceae bacterium TP-CH-4]|uniref:Gliding motility-associated ABC transporter substrate-binding protein GldG n=1 Tax=Pelagihabitans pacificus TaxID=2696054 RepID=A0A967E7G0_9FLAO|nr:gliding motility-associated ABC transporter substrate-binding protein GldG [Pelagihabitans pacificus]NHF61562.1 gliding motility-associated ABC transporter substrate-binding protein GldG [Pelagihabitans pacificus]
MKHKLLTFLKALVILIIVNLVANFLYTRFDLTEDGRYTLSKPAVNSVASFESPVIVDVLLEGNLPPEFIKLKNEVRQILEEFASENNNIKYSFVDPLEGVEQIDGTIVELQSLGLTPTRVTVNDNSKISQEIIFPWAMVNYNNTTIKVPLLKNKQGETTEERVNNSVQHLEYAFADAFTKSAIKEKKRIAVIKGNGELDDIYLADFLTTIRDYYNIGAITLDSVQSSPQKTLDQLNGYDLALIAKPTEVFTDGEKYVLDQFIMHGGKSVWLIDQVNMEIDSLFNENGTALALPRNLNLKDFFFQYGVRLNPDLINDMYFTQIVLATGEGNASQYEPVPWLYNPMVRSGDDHPINNNLEAIRFQFSGSIDTLSNAYSKTVLLQSSPLSKTDNAPRQISLDMINQPPQKELFNNGNQPMAVLIEGDFNSAFRNRVKPVKLSKDLEKGPANKMLVISDGDVIKNQVRNGRPLELGYDKWTSNYYGNKEFLVNAINYMLDDNGLINIRNKKVSIPFLDSNKIAAEKTKWQLLNIVLPVVLTLIFGLGFNYWRKRKYGM